MPRKIKEKYVPPGPEKVQKYSLGDEVLCIRENDEKLGFGKIHQFHPDAEGEYNYFTFQCEMTGSFRLSKIDKIIENPTKSQEKKKNNAVMSLLASLGHRRKKK